MQTIEISCRHNAQKVLVTRIPEESNLVVINHKCIGCNAKTIPDPDSHRAVVHDRGKMWTCMPLEDRNLEEQLVALIVLGAPQDQIAAMQTKVEINREQDARFWGESPQKGETIKEALHRHENTR